MKTLIPVAALFLFPAGVGGQQADPHRKSVATAVGLELALPLAGHLYLGKPVRGILPAAVFISGAGVAVEGYRMMDKTRDSDAGSALAGLVVMGGGVAIMGIGKVWGVASVIYTGHRHNRRLAPTIKVGPNGRVSAGVKLRFG